MRQIINLTVTIDDAQVPPVARLKAALKLLQRGYGIRCIHCADAPELVAHQPAPPVRDRERER